MTSSSALPVAISCGEPAGIGPEIAARAWHALKDEVPVLFLGDPDHLPADVPVARIDNPKDAAEAGKSALPVLAHPFEGPLTHGQPNPNHAQSVIDMIAKGVSLVNDGAASALCTAPIHKKALQDGAGFAFPGHTEFLAEISDTRHVVMMLASDQLRVVPATIHIPLSEVPAALSPEVLEQAIRITHDGLIRNFGIVVPRIAVAGLNPHAGEGGKMGREEIEVITPVLDKLRSEGMDLRGPLSADTMFHAAARVTYDAAVCMYHDQALIPIKTLDFDRGVNVTLGLPFVRTSPDHGTALDIAGKGVANASSMIEAVRLAARLGRARA
ncbi:MULTISPECIES: 4-hydroxythreonine-4-phosphate dehydrogenase PdxA [unclassified Roseovarius]|uniref:4-hydroxythreonine-4-phosphate dehydrogenase PdxA n=1 Tax=unclassified Roseovarius TaxID=2614913 RepID=UPI00273FA2EA|nr:4-hydroxythreonine-4-phosphate dehydrogenase PdxA [Roseovarius sp. MMSF_3350]